MIILLPALGAAVAFVYSDNQEPVYEARVTLLVRQSGNSFSPSQANFSLSQELASTYRRLVTARPFLERVSADKDVQFGPDQLKGMVSANNLENPPVVEVRVRHGDPLVAAATAQAVADEFITYAIEQRLGEIARLQAAAAAQGITNIEALAAAQFAALDSLSLLEPVQPPANPISPRTRFNITVGVLIGLIIATGLAFLLETVRDTVRSPEQLENRFGVISLGVIPRWKPREQTGTGVALVDAPRSRHAESYRQVRANLEFASVAASGNIFLISSPGPEEGKSTTASNVAAAMAQAGKDVVLVDCDLRRPTLHRYFPKVSQDRGLSTVLAGTEPSVQMVIQETGVDRLRLITCGPRPPNPAELLASSKMKSVFEELSRSFDIVLVDCPPLLVVADASILASQVDGVCLVLAGSTTKAGALQAAINILKNARVPILGSIINKAKTRRFGYGYGYSYHGYAYHGYGYHSDEQPQVDADGFARNGTAGLAAKVTSRAASAIRRLRRD